MIEIGSAVIHPEKRLAWRVSRIAGAHAWLKPMTGKASEEGPFMLADLRSAVSRPLKFSF